MTTEQDNGTRRDGGMQVITRAAAILGAIAESGGGENLSELAARTGLPKTTVHRLCAALEQVGYVHTNSITGHRELGGALTRLAVIGRRDLMSLLEPYLARLSRDLNETVDLAVLDGDRILFLAQHPAPHRELMAIARVGTRFPAHSMASGKVLLAQLSEAELVKRLPAHLESPLPGTSRSRATLLQELAEVRTTGLGFEREELRSGICAVAVAVSDSDGKTVSIAVPMPASRFDENREKVATALLRLRDEIHARLRNG